MRYVIEYYKDADGCDGVKYINEQIVDKRNGKEPLPR